MFGLFSYHELFDSREISWDLYCSRTEAAIKLVEKAREFLEFLENVERDNVLTCTLNDHSQPIHGCVRLPRGHEDKKRQITITWPCKAHLEPQRK